MPEAEGKSFARLPGWNRPAFHLFKHTLWMGADHILHVASSGYTEKYRRYYYKDLRAIVIQPNRLGTLKLSLGLGVIFAGFLLTAFLSGGPGIVSISVFGGCAALVLVVQLLLGPECRTLMITRAQTQEIPSLRLLHRAEKALLLLRPRLEAAQAELVQPLQEMASESGNPVQSPEADDAPGVIGEQKIGRLETDSLSSVPYSGLAHILLSVVLLGDCAMSGANTFTNSMAMVVSGSAVQFLTVIFLMLALIKQRGGRMPAAVRKWTWTTVGYVLLLYTCWFAFMQFTMISHPEAVNNQLMIYRIWAGINPAEDVFFRWLNLVQGVLSGLLSAAGAIFLLRAKLANRA